MKDWAGHSLAQYRLREKLGEGGMGEVWRAVDTALDREVALKVLPEALSEDPERLARFEREAKLLASLNHPNIATLFGLHRSPAGDSGPATWFLTMELVSGEDLQQVLSTGPLPVARALEVARQIALAIEAAHDRGMVHRDLKPANVMVTAEGVVKVLDFGLAKVLEGERGSEESVPLSMSPTLTTGATAQGMILGTAAYMSPEQARGQAVDRQADIWAFGCVLFEILTGERAFGGDTVSDTLASVLRAEPDWQALPSDTPGAIRRLLGRCLEKEARGRLHAIADARIMLEEVADDRWRELEPDPVSTVTVPRSASWTLLTVALGVVAGVAAMLLWRADGGQEPQAASAPTAAFRQLTFTSGAEGLPALSPDGESLAYVKKVDGQLDVFMQRVDGANAINLTEGCELDDSEPAYSPDGRRIAYRSECAGGGVFVMGALGESTRRVTEKGHNPSWSPDGFEIAVADEELGLPDARNGRSRIWAVQVESGERRLLSAQDAMQPTWSPAGDWVAFWGLDGLTPVRNLYLVPADGSRAEDGQAIGVTDDPAIDWSPAWAPGGDRLLFASTRGGTMNLWRQAIDRSTGRATGRPDPITAPSSWAGFLSASADGRRLAYVDRNVRSEVFVATFDPVRGRISGPPRAIPLGAFELHDRVSVAPDGSLVFADARTPQHLYLAAPDGTLRQLTEGPHRDRHGVFSPDGGAIFFQSDRWPGWLATIRRDGSALRELPTGGPTPCWKPVISADGRWLAAACMEGAMRLRLDGPNPVGPQEGLPALDGGMSFFPRSFSPDGALLAGALVSPARVQIGAVVLDLGAGTYRTFWDGYIEEALFLPDGHRLILQLERALMLVDLDGGEPRELYAAPAGMTIESLSLSLDGARVAWHLKADESDIWLARFDQPL